jgi:tRNA A-37 threonylcarbamoyl transferase component Bud32/tetratricopeptide (TPR) repeat protein
VASPKSRLDQQPALDGPGDYQLLEEVARGGMGVVYKARQRSLDRIVAVKMIRDSALARPEDVIRFQSEAAAAARLKHPHIVAIHEVGQYAGRHFFSMDYIEGSSLAEFARDHPLSPATAARLVATIATAVQAAHDQGILHRDLKPSNVLIDAQCQPHVTDFGLAKRLEGDSRLTGTEQILGTPAYMPPEQARGDHRQIGLASDVYALGAILYELLVGRPPFRSETPLATIQQALEIEPVSPRRLNPAVAGDLETICLKCLEKEPARRYPTAQALADDLQRHLAGEPIRARHVTTVERGLKWTRRRPATAALLAAVFLVGVAGLGGVLWQWRQAMAARDQLGQALEAKSQLLTDMEAAKNKAEQSAQTSQRVADILTETFQGVDRLGLITDFFLEGSEASTAEIRSLDVLNRAAARMSEIDDAAPAKARLMDTLGIVYMSHGRIAEAAALLEGSLRIRSVQPAPQDEAQAIETAQALAQTQAYLATLRFVQGRHDEAASLAEAAIASGHVVLDQDVVALLLGMLRMETDESDETIREAERLVIAATDERKGLGAKGLRQRALLLAYLAVIRQRRNEHSDSMKVALQAYEAFARIEGGDELTAIFNQWAAGVSEIETADVFGTGDREAGLRRFRQAMIKFTQEMGPTHLSIQFCQVEVARYFEMKGDVRKDPWYYERAEEVYREGLACLLKGCGRQPRTAMCLERLAGLLEKQGRPRDAAAPWREALEIRSTTLGAKHRDTRRAQLALERLGRILESTQ